MRIEKKHIIMCAVFLSVLIWSAVNPKDYITWSMEVFPGIIVFVILVLTWKRFPFTGLVYTLILIHCCILFVGGKYTYAHNPLFDWLKEILSLERNNYDKLGHLAQGFIPTMAAREILIRKSIVRGKGWLAFILICIASFITASYELIEWAAALLMGQGSDEFLGTQGYVWDTQSDMFFAMTGSVLAIILLSKIHDSYLKKMKDRNNEKIQ